MARAIWKGAVSFGLVRIPVALVPATTPSGVDFDWLDKRSTDPVGYKRINKVTGKEVTKKNIVMGVEFEKDRYVVLSEEDIRAAHPKATQTIDIIAFVEASEISPLFMDTPYYLIPDQRGDKVYALLRETLLKTGKVGIANVVMHTKQHLALLMPLGSALVLNTLRWANEVRDVEALKLKPEAKGGDDRRTGCVTSGDNWSKTGATRADIQQDKARCEYEAKFATARYSSGNGKDGMTSAIGTGVGTGLSLPKAD